MLSEHPDGTCTDPEHDAALRRRRAGAAPWSRLVRRADRDYLDGEPIHCGQLLLLQGQVLQSDDYGEFSLPEAGGEIVRYEIDSRGVCLYTQVHGHTVTLRHTEWLRYRPYTGRR
jgi:hypothetical protein